MLYLSGEGNNHIAGMDAHQALRLILLPKLRRFVMALSLKRKYGQRVFIGTPPNQVIVWAWPSDEDPNEIKLYFEAPERVVILREELLQKRQQQSQER